MTTPNKEILQQTTRKRAKNFSEEEEVLLVDLIEAHKNCIENKKSGATIWKQKEEAWRKIEDDFEAKSGTHRNWKALRDKYETMKRKTKAEMAEQKLETNSTDGGVSSIKVNTVSVKIASMLGDSATGLIYMHDSDSLFDIDFESSIDSVDQKQLSNEKSCKANDSMQGESDWSSYGPSTLKEPKETARKRAKNYSEKEEILLVDLVQAHKNCIENKKSDAIIWKQKKEAWRKIGDEFAATSGTHRHWKALREKYEALKRKSRAEMAEQKLEMSNYTDGEVASTKVGIVSEKIASMLGYSATGLKNMDDSDSLFDLDFESSIESVDQKQLSNQNSGKASDSMLGESDWSSCGPSTLKEPKSKELVVGAKRKRNIEEEKIDLIILQQKFYRDENTRAQEKHEQELQSLKLKNELLKLELAEKKFDYLTVKRGEFFSKED